MTPPSGPGWLLLDACCALSLYATRRMADILAATPMRAAIAQKVEDEMRFVYRGGGGPDANDKELVDLNALYAAGLLTVLAPSTAAEVASYVSYAAEVDDGEAMTLALAAHRAMAVSTDDRKARRVFARDMPHLPLYRAVELVHDWAVAEQIAAADLRDVLIDGYERAGLRARSSDALFQWWSTARM